MDYIYNIGKYEVTAAQYTAFLNAVADTDTYGLYSTNMWSNEDGCRIQRTGSAGNYEYTVAADWADRPVNYVSWGDAARFANWLHNGEPTGLQDLTTTEDGAYFLNGATTDVALMAVNREPDWIWAVTSEDEWYKAAYHKNDGVTGNYFDYPTSSDSTPGRSMNEATNPGNNANYYHPDYGLLIGSPYYRTEVGEFELSQSPYGTFDQGGNIWEWNEGIVTEDSTTYRNIRSGSYNNSAEYMQAEYRDSRCLPTLENYYWGFRVASVPAVTINGAHTVTLNWSQVIEGINFGNYAEIDFGDAPDPAYPTLAINQGVGHLIVADAPLLGSLLDVDPNGQPDPGGFGDDNDGTDDEDGVSFDSPLFVRQSTAGTGTVTVNAPRGGKLDAWIDFNQDGVWSHPTEHIFGGTSQTLVAGSQTLDFAIPAGALDGATFARFRISTAGSLPPTGIAPDGEVEDHRITFTLVDEEPPTPPSITGLSDDTGESGSDEVTSDTTPTFHWTASTDTGGSGLAGYWWSLDDPTPESGGTFVPATTLSATATVTANGLHTFHVRAADAAGNFSSVSSLPFTTDTVSPAVVNVVEILPDPRNTAVSTVDVQMSELVDLGTFTYADVSLMRDGSPVMLDGSVALALLSGTTYRISGLSAFTASEGTYVLTVSAAAISDHAGNTGAGLASDQWTTDTTPPAVANVWVRGDAWTTIFLTYLETSGVGDDTYGYAVPVGSADQLKTLPWFGIDTISVQFSEDVNVVEGGLALYGVTVPQYAFAAASFSYDATSYVASWRLNQTIDEPDKLLIDLNGETGGMTDKTGNLLDGEWIDGTSTYPSGNNTAGGDFLFRFNVVVGDADRNTRTLTSDVTPIKQNLGKRTGQAGYSIFFDINGDSRILTSDVTRIKQHLGDRLPLGEPVVPQEGLALTLGSLEATGKSRSVQATYPVETTISSALRVDPAAANTQPTRPEKSRQASEALFAELGSAQARDISSTTDRLTMDAKTLFEIAQTLSRSNNTGNGKTRAACLAEQVWADLARGFLR
ncbi:MAG: SUMF1/EgtB/PvdO family nonheme iron enzyme [Pirellulales bacterium]|nr:SUMF1/EgtB/PvdO family nonheme iron enzyme [Pirellulales bacterium]